MMSTCDFSIAPARAFWSSALLTLRSLLWTLLLPGAVAGYVPWRFFSLDRAAFRLAGPLDVIALLCILAGGALLVSCIVDFAVAGRGTLSPADPPRYLVVRGLYRYVRNPMYLSVTTIVLGEALLTPALLEAALSDRLAQGLLQRLLCRHAADSRW